ncbi:class I SAM-dependent methyltransferase [Actinokineospora iranica]|uniref:Methyltransferase domain-containing protein n=1 Tax=Actinokineospora iranica TaxID=1271860 RepID=A0A1G6NFR3_9PSEU|nr:class I SAM-dependent methyltransferase [Actinokineospora iranica]SDC66672.1 Methyltransferase domain-containing protein [Actinokineospora iranica]
MADDMADDMADYVAVNKANWDERAPAHAASPDYGVRRFLDDPDHISDVVRFDRPRLGDLTGVRGAHLQCHIGTDTLSLARLGARMSGLDFSPTALRQARDLAGDLVDYHEAEVYDAVDVLGARSYDLVYTGIGALCWLPSVERWARVVADLLRPGGRVFLREGHPMLWALDEHADPPAPRYSYFEQAEPLAMDGGETYVATDAVFTHTRSYSWNHGVGEVATALLAAGLRLTRLEEHDSVPWNALPGHMVEDAAGQWRLRETPERLAATYTVEAVKG